MRKELTALVVTATLALGATGCSKDAECEAFITENSAFAAAIKAAHEKDGADGARKAFDDKKADLKKKWDGVKDARGFQLKEEMMKKLQENVASSLGEVCGLGDMKLCTDYTDVLQ